MAEFQSNIAAVATTFGQISAKAVAAQNIQKLKIAEQSIAAGKAQINLEETVGRREIARALAMHQGSVAAAQAFRGAGAAGTGQQVLLSNARQAADEAAVVEANAAAKKAALIAANQPVLDDPLLAGIQGAIQGVEIGTQIAQALIEQGKVVQFQGSKQIGFGPGGIPVFSNVISSFFKTPGFDLAKILKLNLPKG